MTNKYAEHSKADIGRVYQKVAGSTNMCLRKTSFETENQAAKQATQITVEGTPMRAYHCPHCHAWHLTSKVGRHTPPKIDLHDQTRQQQASG